MTIRFDDPCNSSRPSGLALRRSVPGLAAVAGLCLGISGCVLAGIEPDEIDIADDESGEGLETGGEAGGDGDGDPSTGDGDTTGDPTGDGDGDPGDGDGDGDGDPSGDGDGDGDAVPCAELMPLPIYAGPNPIDLANDAGNAFEASCGGPGPDALFEFTATVDGTVTFSLDQPSFDGVLYLAGPSCLPLTELVCDAESVEATLSVGESIFIIVDSTQAELGGTATLTVTVP